MDNTNARPSWLKDHLPSKRRLIQLYVALLYNAHLRGFVEGDIYTGAAKAACVPGLNCYSCPGAIGACPLGSLQAELGTLDKSVSFYVVGILLLYGMLAGRTICGWACPLGLIQELLYKLPTPKIRKGAVTRALSYLKYAILAVLVIAVTMWCGDVLDVPVPAFCKYLCPAGTFEGAMALIPQDLGKLSMLGILFTRKFVIMLLIALACVFCFRSFCRFLCPLGAIYGMFNRLSLIGIRVDAGTCNGCGTCVRKCKMDVRRVGDHECIHCAKCVATCPVGAISMKAGRVTLIAPEKGGSKLTPEQAEKRHRVTRIAWSIAVAVLCFALVWFNFLDPSVRPAIDATDAQTASVAGGTDAVTGDFTSDAPVGFEVGDQLADFNVELLDGSTFHLYENRGKVTFVNLWATYCGPCVQELPHFQDLARKHGQDVAVLLCHRFPSTEKDLVGYVEGKGLDPSLFCVDTKDNEIFKIVNGSSALPKTIVLDRHGEIIYSREGSVTPELLEQLFEQGAGS